MKLMVQSEEENAVNRLLFFSQRTLVLSIERAKSMKYFDVLLFLLRNYHAAL